MKAVLWRLDDDQAMVYTEDRGVLARLLEMEPFLGRDPGRLTAYMDARGRVVGWQAPFPAYDWIRLTRRLHRQSIDLEYRTAVVSPAAATKPESKAVRAARVVRPARAPSSGGRITSRRRQRGQAAG